MSRFEATEDDLIFAPEGAAAADPETVRLAVVEILEATADDPEGRKAALTRLSESISGKGVGGGSD